MLAPPTTDVCFAAALIVTHPVRAEDWNHLFHKHPLWTEASCYHQRLHRDLTSKVVGILTHLFLFFLFCLHTVCNGHHRTEVHLTGHRLPGALLTDSKLSSSYSDCTLNGFQVTLVLHYPLEATRGHWSLSSILLTSPDQQMLRSL